MQYTDNYGMRLPIRGVDRANVDDLNYNANVIDGAMFDNRNISLKMYNDNGIAVYNTGDIVGQVNLSGHISAYVCLDDNVSGTWDATKWDITDLSEQIMIAKQSGGATELDELDDVSITSPTAGQVVTYDGTDWVNADPQGGDVTKTATGNPIELTDGADAPLVKCVTQITGSQDLHGYDKPWVGGAGKNKLPLVLADIKTLNTSGTWSGDAYTISGVTFTILTDSNGNVTGVSVNGTASENITFLLTDTNGSWMTDGTTYKINGSVGGSYNTWSIWVQGHGTHQSEMSLDGDGTFTYTAGGSTSVRISVDSGVSLSNQMFRPMIRLSTEADSNFAPYSNICPITAYTEGEIEVSDGDGNVTTTTTTYPSAIYRGSEDVVNGEVSYDKLKIVFTGAVDENWSTEESSAGRNFYINISDALPLQYAGTGLLSNIFEASPLGTMMVDKILISNGKNLNVPVGDSLGINTVADWKTWLSTHNLEVVYNTTPTTSSVTPTNLPIKSLSGYNHIESTTGEMEIEYITQAQQPLIDLIPEESGGGGTSYDTTEQVIGTWVDGRDVYRKLVTVQATWQNLSNGTSKSFAYLQDWVKEIDYVTNAVAVGSEQYYANMMPIAVQTDKGSGTATAYCNNPFAGSFTSMYVDYVILEYVKIAPSRSLAKSAPQEEQVEELKEEPTEETKKEVKEEPEEKVEEEKEENENQSESSTR